MILSNQIKQIISQAPDILTPHKRENEDEFVKRCSNNQWVKEQFSNDPVGAKVGITQTCWGIWDELGKVK